ncbi:MAG: NF038120 family PEP-CTERM protein [Pseudomonadota bacterium]
MKRTAQSISTPSTARPALHRLLAGALVAAAFAMPAAQAAVIDFEGIGNDLVGHNDVFQQGGLALTGYSLADNALSGDLVGAVVDGTDLGICAGLACPANNQTSFYSALNDSALFIDPAHAGDSFKIKGFDASFIGAVAGASYPATAGLLRVQGFFADGSTVFENYALNGPTAGSFGFQHFNTSSTFGEQAFSQVAIFGFTCNSTGSCSAFSTNKGQFAIDNILVAVPEPTTYLMMLLGLASIGAVARRRRVK